MSKQKLISANDFCVSHDIEISFISALQESGLVKIEMIEETAFIPVYQLRQLEKIVRLYYDLDINLEGIETINHLLNRVVDMQEEITVLKNRLRLFEADNV
jgi:hypothetical protein